MSGGSIQIIILLILAVVIFMRLMNEFGKRDGFEPERQLKPVDDKPRTKPMADAPVEDVDIFDERIRGEIAKAKSIEPGFRVDGFLRGSKGAYEMILMSYLKGDMLSVRPFVDQAVFDGFQDAIEERQAAGHFIDAEFLGLNNVSLQDARFDEETGELELSVEFIAQLRQQVVDENGALIEGDKNKVETERDLWHFARVMGSNDPNWQLVATGE